ncbi:MAG TPA: helix-turn-helix transcriptional regulator [Actinophytocola sp.]|uniref:helix-turn-helix domain-containing protein n=1 Tax=Actinophytocola sp. TaxID=1872138 RepID=UPI002DBED2DF|nr:helix-turn-helix transcriptional regulator [Actinophytocola sp.]HEU5472844.1 helix-turn-helix transcriptional regulator [Actinophytocola sp.]
MGGKHRPGTPRDRALGAELRVLREQAGKSLADVAGAIHWNVSTLSRLERGQRHISPEAIQGLAVIYELSSQRRDALLARAREPVALGWWDRPPAGLTNSLGALASYEHEATRLTDWSPGVVPGLLQTKEYSIAIMRDWGVADNDVNPRLGARMQRQELLARREVDYTAFVGVAALCNRLCGTDEFVRQLRHLIRVSTREGVTVRIVDAPTSFTLGSWYLMDFEHTGPVVHLEHLRSATFLFDKETAAYVAARSRLDRIALGEQESRDKIESLVERLIMGS